jgi:hypothetical protein
MPVLHNDNHPGLGLYAGGERYVGQATPRWAAVVSDMTWALAEAYRCAFQSVKEMV